jgi:hypothetical protein
LFYTWRSDRDYRAEITAKRGRGEKLDTEIPSSMMRCVCGEMFDSHNPEQSFPQCRHIYAAQADKRGSGLLGEGILHTADAGRFPLRFISRAR